jgi:predicted nucleotidyltransferase
MSTLEERKEFSENQIIEVGSKIQQIENIETFNECCIFVCGSYGRKEAHDESDLDLFFINFDLNGQSKPPSKVDEILLFADLIKIIKALSFPDFSNDGEYLKIHSLNEILGNLGSPKDDYSNYFTTRMLLILESLSIYNNHLHEKIIKESIKKYFVDFEDHQDNFRPIFLINDIIRFWKTMCLNYENKRLIPSESPEEKSKRHLKNLKLKFSRLTTCFSMVIPLSCETKKPFTEEIIFELTKLPPLERLERCAHENNCKKEYQNLADKYLSLLDKVSQKDIIEKLKDGKYRESLFKEANNYAQYIYNFLIKVADKDALRFITI